MTIIADLHTHTKFSADGRSEMEDMCKSAIDKGLSYICFTDHIDSNPNDLGYNFLDYEKYSDSISRAQDKFGNRIHILKGVEFAEPHIYKRQFEEILAKDFDLIMVGMHYLGNSYVGDIARSNCCSKDQLFHRYYEELLKVVKTGGFDVLAHFDLPKRYLKDSCEDTELVDEILQELVKKDLAIEVNTSSLRRGYHESLPGYSLLNRYIKAGGSKVTTGSDAHSYGEIGADFDHALKLIKECNGCRGIFKERKFIPIQDDSTEE